MTGSEKVEAGGSERGTKMKQLCGGSYGNPHCLLIHDPRATRAQASLLLSNHHKLNVLGDPGDAQNPSRICPNLLQIRLSRVDGRTYTVSTAHCSPERSTQDEQMDHLFGSTRGYRGDGGRN